MAVKSSKYCTRRSIQRIYSNKAVGQDSVYYGGEGNESESPPRIYQDI